METQNAFYELAGIAWMAFGAFWLFMALRTKRAVKRQSRWSRLLHIGIGALAFWLLFSQVPSWGLLGRPFVASTAWVWAAGGALTCAGIALAIWARVLLGRNWSGAVTIKQDHQLIRQGPYAALRHPIYSGMLLAVLGTALVVGRVRGLAAFVLVFVMFLAKSRIEERFMVEQFGEVYRDYRRRTSAMVPFVL